MKSKLSFRAAVFAVLCVSFASTPVFAGNIVFDEDGPSTTVEALGASATSRPEDHHYFTIAPDPRLCPSPLCGGYFVTRVNRPFTVCADGRQAARCYVAELDFSLSGFSPAQENTVRGAAAQSLVRGSIEPKQFGTFGNLGSFSVREASIGHRGVVASGTFYRARNTGIVCIAFPCPSFQVTRLNRSTRPQRIAGVDLQNVSADPSDGYNELNSPEGLLTAGNLTPVSGPAGSSSVLESTEYYLPVEPEKDICGLRGLPECASDEFCNFSQQAACGRADTPGSCEVRPQACTLQYDAVCGCDGQTYSNECAAEAAGVSVDYGGACK